MVGLLSDGYELTDAAAPEAAFAKAFDKVYGGAVEDLVFTALTDTRFYGLNYGIPSLCFGASGGEMHGFNEFVDLDSLKKSTKARRCSSRNGAGWRRSRREPRCLRGHCERSEAIQDPSQGQSGLLRRYAPRNDGGTILRVRCPSTGSPRCFKLKIKTRTPPRPVADWRRDESLGVTMRDWDDAYANSAHIPGSDKMPAQWTERAAAYRAGLKGFRTDIAYGDRERQRLDLILPDGDSKGLVVFVQRRLLDALRQVDLDRSGRRRAAPRLDGGAAELHPDTGRTHLRHHRGNHSRNRQGRFARFRSDPSSRSFRRRPSRHAHAVRRQPARTFRL